MCYDDYVLQFPYENIEFGRTFRQHIRSIV